MTYQRFLKPAIWCLVGFFGVAQPGRADPLVVTTGGFGFSEGDSPSIVLLGSGFDLSAFGIVVGHSAAFDVCNFHCDPGTTVNLGTHINGFIESSRQTMFGATSFAPPIYFAGDRPSTRRR